MTALEPIPAAPPPSSGQILPLITLADALARILADDPNAFAIVDPETKLDGGVDLARRAAQDLTPFRLERLGRKNLFDLLSDDGAMRAYSSYGDECAILFADVVAAFETTHVWRQNHTGLLPIIEVTPIAPFRAECLDMSYVDLRNLVELDDPFFDVDAEAEEPFSLAGAYTEDDLEQVVRDIVRISAKFPAHCAYIRVHSNGGGYDEPSLSYHDAEHWELEDRDEDYEIDEHTENLLGAVLSIFQPRGYHYEYNDGVRNRVSGWSMESRSYDIELDIKPPSATLRAVAVLQQAQEIEAARARLVAWMTAQRFPDDVIALARP